MKRKGKSWSRKSEEEGGLFGDVLDFRGEGYRRQHGWGGGGSVSLLLATDGDRGGRRNSALARS